jgi:hypothetical protein
VCSSDLLAQEQQREAAEFKKNLPSMKQQETNLAFEGIRDDLAQGTRDVQGEANRRGLLYSGIREEAESKMQSKAAQEQAMQSQAINQRLDAQSKDMERQALSADLNYQNMVQQREMQLYQMALDRRARRGQMLGGLGSAIGGIAGFAMGGPAGGMAGSQMGSGLGAFGG